jgi:dipeptidyl aminopeptidase/acylaminoacyl peptidase
MAQPFDPEKLRVSGDPVPVAEQAGSEIGVVGFFSASPNGVLAFTRGESPGSRLIWLDRQGKISGTLAEDAGFAVDIVNLSSDGKQAAVSRMNLQGGADIWLYDVTGRGAPSRFTFDSAFDMGPVFSPDGSRIVFESASNVSGGYLYQKLANGTKNAEPLLKTEEPSLPSGWSPDGRFLLYTATTEKSKGNIWVLPMDGNQKTPVLFQGTESYEDHAQFSPDGHWIAYDSDATGRSEVYVREFRLGSGGKPEGTPTQQISSGGGISPRWRGDGKELFYVSGDRKTILSVDIATKPDFQFSATKLSVPVPLGVLASAPVFPSVTSDGQRFLAAAPVAQSTGPHQFTVVLNWPSLLKK